MAKGDINRLIMTSGTACSCVVQYLLLYSPGGSTGREVGPVRCILGPPFWRREGRRGSAMAPLERVTVVSYRLSIVTTALTLTISLQFDTECLRCSNQHMWLTLGQNLGRKGLTDVSQILTRLGTVVCQMGLSHVKEIVSLTSAV